MSEAPSTQPRTPTEPNDAPVTPTPPTPTAVPVEAPATPKPTLETSETPVAVVRPPADPTDTPAITRPSSEAAETSVKIARQAIEPSDAHVLVVEDNVPNFVLIARMLAFMGVQRCEWKTSGWQVVQFADTLPRVDLILMDIRLPYEDGYQALQKLRANNRLKDTIVCAVTAEASEDQMRRAKRSGFNGFLGKPLDPDRFPLQIRRLLTGEEVWEWK
jgi:two-component system cell cycle response regulator DivK